MVLKKFIYSNKYHKTAQNQIYSCTKIYKQTNKKAINLMTFVATEVFILTVHFLD